MKTAALLVIVLSHAGYWFGGQENTITLQPNLQPLPMAADLSWELRVSGVRLSQGTAILARGGGETVIRMTPPTVRVRTELVWAYRLTSRENQKELEHGEQTISLFPQDVGLARVIKQQQRAAGEMVVVEQHDTGQHDTGQHDTGQHDTGQHDTGQHDTGQHDLGQRDSLTRLLEQSNASVTRIADANKLQLLHPRIVLVGPDALAASGFDQSPLVNLAKYGASVMIFRQSRCESLVGYELARRELPARLEWRTDHPLLRGLTEADLDSWFTNGAEQWAVQLPPDEPALEIGYWPREIPGVEASPIDALLLTRTIGKGRLVLCQIPLGPWDQDPRSQILLANALDYLHTRPEPTPPPSQRPMAAPIAPMSVPTITIPAGDKP